MFVLCSFFRDLSNQYKNTHCNFIYLFVYFSNIYIFGKAYKVSYSLYIVYI